MRTVSFVVSDGFQVMGLAPLTVFEIANRTLDEPGYDIRIVSEHGGPVRSSLGFTVETEPVGARHPDTVMAVGTLVPAPSAPAVLDYLRATAVHSRRVAGICTGAFVLAQAGLLDGRRATTHWAFARTLQRAYPGIRVEEDRIFISDGRVWTSAGMSAGIDLALALLEEDFGAAMAKTVARRLVVYHRRPGGQSQFSALLELEPKSDRVRRALTYAKEHLTSPLSVEELAAAASLSPRQFSRVFRQETGQSPAKAVENLRLEAARSMMAEGRHPMDLIARETGFADRERMRRAFLRAYGQPPQALKRAASADRQAKVA
ncbi:GlxA family transcriptional regulator [Arenibaculum pallidiluteum]|uniref:GlxA family transcriptional regulator n=1 Tax=Arenibaculum pallidiluteum TaxID=2812559 RepID=UPI001A979303|nr:GlxA family transcriptional regulator [Arenibaculum pallidiluteum]